MGIGILVRCFKFILFCFATRQNTSRKKLRNVNLKPRKLYFLRAKPSWLGTLAKLSMVYNIIVATGCDKYARFIKNSKPIKNANSYLIRIINITVSFPTFINTLLQTKLFHCLAFRLKYLFLLLWDYPMECSV